MPYTESSKNLMLDALTATITHISLHTADPGTDGSNEVSGGSPAYARVAVSWEPASGGVAAISNTPTFDVPGSTTVTHMGFWTSDVGGTFIGGCAVIPETFNNQGTYPVTAASLDLNA